MKINLVDVDNIQNETFRLHRKNGTDDYLFVLFKSPAEVSEDEKSVITDFGSFIVFDKHNTQSYHPIANKKFTHDFMHFNPETNYEKKLISDIPKGKLHRLFRPHIISNVLLEIKNEIINPFEKYKENILTNLGMIFLYRIKSEFENSLLVDNKGYFNELCNLRTDIYRNPQMDWSVENMCRRVCLSRSYFQKLYLKFFSVSCNRDVINARISHAKMLLANNMLSVNSVAEKCGYKNTEHFIRQFKQETGVSPKKFQFRDSLN